MTWEHRLAVAVFGAAVLIAGSSACGDGAATGVVPPSPRNPPSHLTYSSRQASYVVGVAIPPNVPQSSGGAVASYSVSPALPAGLSLNATTGLIAGTPATVTAAASYVVTATNSGGSTTFTLSIEVTASTNPPTDLMYSTNPA